MLGGGEMIPIIKSNMLLAKRKWFEHFGTNSRNSLNLKSMKLKKMENKDNHFTIQFVEKNSEMTLLLLLARNLRMSFTMSINRNNNQND